MEFCAAIKKTRNQSDSRCLAGLCMSYRTQNEKGETGKCVQSDKACVLYSVCKYVHLCDYMTAETNLEGRILGNKRDYQTGMSQGEGLGEASKKGRKKETLPGPQRLHQRNRDKNSHLIFVPAFKRGFPKTMIKLLLKMFKALPKRVMVGFIIMCKRYLKQRCDSEQMILLLQAQSGFVYQTRVIIISLINSWCRSRWTTKMTLPGCLQVVLY